MCIKELSDWSYLVGVVFLLDIIGVAAFYTVVAHLCQFRYICSDGHFMGSVQEEECSWPVLCSLSRSAPDLLGNLYGFGEK